MTQIERIKAMEKCLEESKAAIGEMSVALAAYEAAQKSYRKLCDYYGSGTWLKDYEDDEKGKIPKNLKRGVLSEDAVYDIITENHDITSRLLKIISENFKGYR